MSLLKVENRVAKRINRIPQKKNFVQLEPHSDIINLNLGQPDFRTPQNIIEAAIIAMKSGQTTYSDPRGIIELRNAISDKLKRENGVIVDPKHEILITCGAQHAISLLMTTFVDQGDEIIIPDPLYTSYPFHILLNGGMPIHAKVKSSNNFSLKAEDVQSLISDRTKMIVLNSPCMPTGGMYTEKDIRKIADIAIENDILILSDELYEKITYDEKHFSIGSIPGLSERTFTIQGFSKTYSMTGFRVGYIAGPNNLIQHLLNLHSHSVICATSISQYAALEALQGPQNFVHEMVEEYRQRRDLIVKRFNEFPNVECNAPKGSYYAFPNFNNVTKDDVNLAKYIAEKSHVLFAPGSNYGPSGAGYLKAAFTTTRDILLEGMDRVERVLSQFQSSS